MIIKLGDKLSNYLISISWLNGFQGNPNDTRGGFIGLEERILANDKQKHGALAMFWGLIGFFMSFIILKLEVDAFSYKDIIAMFLGGVFAGIVGIVIELFQKLDSTRNSNKYDAIVMFLFGLLMCVFIILFKVTRLIIINQL